MSNFIKSVARINLQENYKSSSNDDYINNEVILDELPADADLEANDTIQYLQDKQYIHELLGVKTINSNFNEWDDAY